GGVWLYNPGNTSCYWGWVRAPGGAVTTMKEEGPQPIDEMHNFKAVDYWFTPIPTRRRRRSRSRFNETSSAPTSRSAVAR
ncbi:MAG: hypothetical protein JWM74_2334, partial [Myxococcaceae bacterium]|nr:hypothetical protein [Myxococcaceae bacterium]